MKTISFAGILAIRLPKRAHSPEYFLNLIKILEKNPGLRFKWGAVNEYRALIHADPLSLSKKKLIEADYQNCFRSLSLKIATEVFKTKEGSALKNHYKKIITSPLFLKLSKKFDWLEEFADRLLGLNEWKVKNQLLLRPALSLKSEDLYLEIPPYNLFTPYRVISQIVKHLPNCSEIVDLGSGLGRFVFAVKATNPSLKLTGIEVLNERFEQSAIAQKKLGFEGVQLFEQNINDIRIPFPKADYYFLFNPFSHRTLVSVFNSLVRTSKKRDIKIVVVKVGRTHTFFQKNKVFKKIFQKDISGWDGIGYEIYSTR